MQEKIDHIAWENCRDKLASANERIITLLDQRDPLLKELDKLRKEVQQLIFTLNAHKNVMRENGLEKELEILEY